MSSQSGDPKFVYSTEAQDRLGDAFRQLRQQNGLMADFEYLRAHSPVLRLLSNTLRQFHMLKKLAAKFGTRATD